MPIVIPRLVVEVFQHTNFRGRMGYVVEPVHLYARHRISRQYFFCSRL